MSDTASEESNLQVKSSSIESKCSISPAFWLGLFERKVIDPSLPIQEQKVLLTCNAPGCAKTYKHPYPGNTSTLLNHYKSKHPHLLIKMGSEALKSGKPIEDTILGTNLLENLKNLPPEITNYFQVDTKKSKKRLGNILNTPSYTNCSPKYFKKIFTQYLIGLNIPFNTCDDYLTKRMLEGARFGLSKVVSRGQVTLQLKKIYFRVVGKLKDEFREHNGRFALTIDEWKASNDKKFLGITLHFLNNAFELKRYNIGLEHLAKKDGNAKSITIALMRVLQYYQIDDRIVSISRDNASVMTKVVTNFKNMYHGQGVDQNFDGDIRCFGHVSNLAVQALMAYAFPKKTATDTNIDTMDDGDPLEDNDPVADNDPTEDEIFARLPANIKSFPDRVRKFIRAVNKNDMLGCLFDKAVAKRNQKDSSRKEKLNKENPTRWLSQYEMLDSFLYFKEQIIEVYKELDSFSQAKKKQIGVFEITESEWEYLKVLRDILHVFVKPTKCLQGSTYVTIYATIPTVHLLLEELKKNNTQILRELYPNISIGLTAASDKLKKYYPIYGKDCGRMKYLYIATVLDPQYKLIYFQAIEAFPRELITCIKKDLEALYKLYKEYYAGQGLQNGANSESDSQANHESNPVDEEQEIRSFLRKYAVVNQTENEVETYLFESLEESSIVEYYRSKRKRYPILYHLAKDIMAIPAMSAPAESFFSVLGDIVTKKRNRLLPATTKMLAVVKDIVKKRRPGDVESGVESGDDIGDDDAELAGQISREINDGSFEVMEEDTDNSIENSPVYVVLDD